MLKTDLVPKYHYDYSRNINFSSSKERIDMSNTHIYSDTYQKACGNFYDTEPAKAIEWDFNTSLENLSKIIGKDKLKDIFNGKKIDSPTSKNTDGEWLKQSKIIGINPRAIGNYWNIVKYAMTFPEDSIHLLPLFDQGCSGSLYSPLNWKLSDEFLDEDLSKIGFNTPEKQLKLVINVLHALGKNVGMDFLQHTDRFSEEVFLHPDFFNWVKLNDNKTQQLFYPDVNPDLIPEEVKNVIKDFIKEHGCADGTKVTKKTIDNLYSPDISDDKRRAIIIGNGDINSRNSRRIELMNTIREHGFETLPVHIDSPLTPVFFKKIESNNGLSWATFQDYKENRFFGNLTPFKLYHVNKTGEIDKDKPNEKVWDYLCKNVREFQKDYNFDFLRADMGYLDFEDGKRDIQAAVKNSVRKNNDVYHFATFGECFSGTSLENRLSLLRKKYDAVLGNLHYQQMDDDDFLDIVKRYNFNPDFKISVTSITADSDQARYNYFYDAISNQVRSFLGLFLNQPSYTGMGIETRDINPTESRKLTKDYINDWGNPPYEWGKNHEFFNIFSGMRQLYSNIKETLSEQSHYWLSTNDKKVASWFYYSDKNKIPSYLFVANADKKSKSKVEIENIFDTNIYKDKPASSDCYALKNIYSTDKPQKIEGNIIIKNKKFKVTNLPPGGCRVYKVLNNKDNNRQ